MVCSRPYVRAACVLSPQSVTCEGAGRFPEVGPTAALLDEVCAELPCYCRDVNGHEAWVNTCAMQARSSPRANSHACTSSKYHLLRARGYRALDLRIRWCGGPARGFHYPLPRSVPSPSTLDLFPCRDGFCAPSIPSTPRARLQRPCRGPWVHPRSRIAGTDASLPCA